MELGQKYKKLRTYTIIMIAVLLLAAVSVLFKSRLSLLLIAAAVVYHFAFLKRTQKDYTETFTAENLRRTVMKKLSAEMLNEKNGGKITLPLIRSAELIPVDEGDKAALLLYGMSGKIRGLPVDVCDATLAESFTLTKNGKHRVHHNSGAWFHIALQKDTGLNLRILDEDAVPLVMKQNFYKMKTHLSQIPSSKINLPEKFYTYAGGRAEDITVSTEFIRAFLSLSEYTPGKLAISIRGNTADVFLRARFFGMPVSLSSEPSEKSLDFDPMPELQKIVDMVNML